MERASLLDVPTPSYLAEIIAPPLRAILRSPLQRRRNRLLKRSADVLGSTVLILLLFPWFLPVAALLICLDSRGPVFFRQRRHKKDGIIFFCYKLRTMHVNREADSRPAFAGDERITRVGRLLRGTHLDELPQLINVFLGDMSLIGPRPHMLSENAAFAASIPGYDLRHQVKPGITGLAQVRGLVGATEDPDALGARLHADIHYIRHWSPALEARIAWHTFSGIFRSSKKRSA